MANPKLIRCRGSRMRILGEMTVYNAAALHAQVQTALAERAALETLDLSEVTEFDTAGLQILLATRRWASAAGRTLRMENPSPAVSSVLDLLRLNSMTESDSQAAA